MSGFRTIVLLAVDDSDPSEYAFDGEYVMCIVVDFDVAFVDVGVVLLFISGFWAIVQP